MTKNLQQVVVFVRPAFVAVVGIFFIALSVFAQAPASSPAGGTAEAERVIVAGSLIPTAEEVTANPVDVVSQQEIRASGQTVDILNVLTKRDPDCRLAKSSLIRQAPPQKPPRSRQSVRPPR
jgi:hypothetical protein